ncbi:MAG: hypothetical protein ACOC13_02425, partial [Tangfeifania sp.]
MKKLAFTGILWVAVICVFAQTESIQVSPVLTGGTPESVGISSERLARVDQMCREAVVEGDVPGIVSLIARDGKIV